MEEKQLPYYKIPFYYFLVIIIIFIILSFLIRNFYLIIISISLVILAIVIYIKGCPNCKWLFTEELIGEGYIETKLKPYHYIKEDKYYYSNGSYKDSIFSEEKTIMERVEKYKILFKCKKCNYRRHRFFEKNIDKLNRPKTVFEVHTNIKAPRNCIICGKSLRTRRKYCSECRPFGRSTPRDFYLV